jgi:arabinoxylan arabinofuranohydrolase
LKHIFVLLLFSADFSVIFFYFLIILKHIMQNYFFSLLFFIVCTFSISAQTLLNSNPVIPGYYADPTVIQDGGKFYIYATLDPWGGDELGLWESADFKNWTLIPLNWPTKQLCKSATSNNNKVWAPSVIKGKDGKFHMFVSVGSEVYAGVADKPIGPWKNAVADNKPLITTQEKQGIHTIDAEAFIDDDNQAYLYWGSGLHWVNGHCIVAKLNREMNALVDDYKDITPKNYFEGPYMFKKNGTYYLTYSEGLCTDHSYRVEYSTSKSPFGPFTLGKNSPILSSNLEIGVKGPGHHTILTYKGEQYIIYHRISPNESALHRQICIDKLEFDAEGNFKKVVPTNAGVLLSQKSKSKSLQITKVSASSSKDNRFEPSAAIDSNYATLWKPIATDSISWLKVDLGKVKPVSSCETRFEFPNRVTRYKIEYSSDNCSWLLFADNRNSNKQGSPMINAKKVNARYIRITILPISSERTTCGIWEFVVK